MPGGDVEHVKYDITVLQIHELNSTLPSTALFDDLLAPNQSRPRTITINNNNNKNTTSYMGRKHELSRDSFETAVQPSNPGSRSIHRHSRFTTPHHTTPHHATPHNTTQYTIPHHYTSLPTARHHPTPRHIIPHHTALKYTAN